MEESLEDFLKKYKGTFVFLETAKEKRRLVEFVTADENSLHFTSPETGSILVRFDNAKKVIRTVFPEVGLYNIGDTLFVDFFRVPERQWKRSPCRSNCAFGIPLHNTMATPTIDYNTMSQAFAPWYPNSKEEAEKAIAERGGVALNTQFGITLSDTADYNLWYRLSCIGTIKDNQIKLNYIPLTQEVKDFFGENLTWTNK